MVHTASWPHHPNKNVFSDRRNRLYDGSTSLRCDAKLFHSPGPTAATALSPKLLCVRVTTHVRFSVDAGPCRQIIEVMSNSLQCSYFQCAILLVICQYSRDVLVCAGVPCERTVWYVNARLHS